MTLNKKEKFRKYNFDHNHLCACLTCKYLPKIKRYSKQEWDSLWPTEKRVCKFCLKTAVDHAASWPTKFLGEKIDSAHGSCGMEDLEKMKYHSMGYDDDDDAMFSALHFYIPKE